MTYLNLYFYDFQIDNFQISELMTPSEFWMSAQYLYLNVLKASQI